MLTERATHHGRRGPAGGGAVEEPPSRLVEGGGHLAERSTSMAAYSGSGALT